MKQKFFDEIDSGWEDLLSDIYTNSKYFKPEYEIIDGKKYISKQYTNEDIGDKKMLSLDNKLIEIGYMSFDSCTNLIGCLFIPDSVEYIGSSAFYKCSGFTSLKLSNKLNNISEMSFAGCYEFTGELVIPDSVKIIELGAFSGCSGFTSLKLSKNLKTIGSLVFTNCTGLSGELVIPKSVEYMSDEVFSGCKFSKIYVPKNNISKYDKRWNKYCNAEIIEY